MTVLEDKAKELGRLIGQTPEYQAVRRSNDALGEDRAAVALLKQMEQLRVDAQLMIERGESPTPDMEQQLDHLLEQVQVNPLYQRVVSAQENFDKIMMRVNDWILDGIQKGGTSPIITLG
ncbi:MAG TPA: YlbF family regulator [Gemmatimonadaceae bacterium]